MVVDFGLEMESVRMPVAAIVKDYKKGENNRAEG